MKQRTDLMIKLPPNSDEEGFTLFLIYRSSSGRMEKARKSKFSVPFVAKDVQSYLTDHGQWPFVGKAELDELQSLQDRSKEVDG